ncbi:hypothetical protein QVD17_01388 [Tagetes erecta]|uniref:Uncharacterized protein n=1 Tax=Tagetes erecta TaxID=13708 RepID=A0AAD8L6A6_TARER|nr:hypothetical protein QVD17_01388 [Tagetes erecta]
MDDMFAWMMSTTLVGHNEIKAFGLFNNFLCSFCFCFLRVFCYSIALSIKNQRIFHFKSLCKLTFDYCHFASADVHFDS